MNKNELILAISEKAILKKKDTEKFLKAFEDAIAEELSAGGKVQLVGLEHSMLPSGRLEKAEIHNRAKLCPFRLQKP